jgi:hypothetical protein
MRAIAAIALALAILAAPARSDPIPSGAVQVVDGDTIRVRGWTVRLVGFDTPESGTQARCEGERNLAARATRRLRSLVTGGGPDLQIVRCSCPPGTEGTQRCNYGRACCAWTVHRVDRLPVALRRDDLSASERTTLGMSEGRLSSKGSARGENSELISLSILCSRMVEE